MLNIAVPRLHIFGDESVLCIASHNLCGSGSLPWLGRGRACGWSACGLWGLWKTVPGSPSCTGQWPSPGYSDLPHPKAEAHTEGSRATSRICPWTLTLAGQRYEYQLLWSPPMTILASTSTIFLAIWQRPTSSHPVPWSHFRCCRPVSPACAIPQVQKNTDHRESWCHQGLARWCIWLPRQQQLELCRNWCGSPAWSSLSDHCVTKAWHQHSRPCDSCQQLALWGSQCKACLRNTTDCLLSWSRGPACQSNEE